MSSRSERMDTEANEQTPGSDFPLRKTGEFIYIKRKYYI